MAKKAITSSKNQLSFDAFLKPAAKPVAPKARENESVKHEPLAVTPRPDDVSFRAGKAMARPVAPIIPERGSRPGLATNPSTGCETEGSGKATIVQAQPTIPNTQVKSILSEKKNQVTGVTPDLTHDAVSASHDNKKTEGIAHEGTHEGTALQTGYGNVVVVPNFSSGTLFPTKKQLKKAKPIEAPIPRTDGSNVDLSKYQVQDTGPRIRKDGFVYYCRHGKHHFIGPVIINTSIKQNDPFFDIFTCPVCGSAAINNVSFHAIPDPAGIGKDFCAACGCETEKDIRGGDTKICYNCNRDLEALKLKMENRK
jgi:transcription elongation factor Elf1